MRRFSTVTAMLAVAMLMACWSGTALADQPAAGSSKKAAAAARLNSPRTTVGEVVDLVPGKSVRIKEESGAQHTYGLAKSTKIDGELKVGGRITVMSTGRWAREITVNPDTSNQAGMGAND
jgi:hypothetical protein